MVIVHIQIHVRVECAEAFIIATRENAQASVREPGIARFEFSRRVDDPNRFVLVEHYRDEAAARAHKETAHYLKWRDTVAPMMAEPRTSVRLAEIP
ncbi:MAG TPA: putative quinol monooxygenase [Verrucomicrobiae bacterium]|nr:putative quinol monooxygenase [Verrucomicrobiae bacterium]